MKGLVRGFGLACLTVGLTATSTDGGFFFSRFERRDSTRTDVAGATRALSAYLPIGTRLSAYHDFFRSIGGRCAAIADAKRFPDTLLCSSSHGIVVLAEWRLVVRFDPVSQTAQDQELSFGLTGL